MQFTFPRPRDPIADENLKRPDWTHGVPRDPKKLWLDKNENIDPEIYKLTAKVIASVDPSAIYTYPDLAPLYQKLGNQLGVAPNKLALTAGSDGAIRAVFESFINPGDVVLHTQPTFAMYAVYCQMFGAKPVRVVYQPSPSGPLLPLQDFVGAIRNSRPKLICLPNPDSPTGTVFDPDALRRLIETAGEVGSLMLLDEAYYPFYEKTALPWIDEYSHLVVIRTFSKAWGLAGLRLGYLAACAPLTRIIHKVRPLYEIGSFDAMVLFKLLDHVEEINQSVRRQNEGRDAFITEMKRLDLRTFPSYGSFCHVDFGRHRNRIHDELQELVLYRKDSNDPCLAGFSRFTSASRKLLEPIMDRIRKVVQHG